MTGEADGEFEANFPSFPSHASREMTAVTTAEDAEETEEEKTSSSSRFSSLGRLKRNEEGASSSSSPRTRTSRRSLASPLRVNFSSFFHSLCFFHSTWSLPAPYTIASSFRRIMNRARFGNA